MLYRQPLTTLDDHLARGSRVAEALRDLVEGFERRDDDAVLPVADPTWSIVLRPPSPLGRLRGACPDDVERRGGEVPETWYELPIF